MPALRSAAVAVAVAVACAGAPALRAQSTLPAPTGRWVATIAQLNELRGAAELNVASRGPRESRFRLSVRLVPINRQLAWDVVVGRCGGEGRPLAAAAAFRQILSRNDGSGEATATLPALETGKAYYVRVFAPGVAPSDRTAYGCANLSEVP